MSSEEHETFEKYAFDSSICKTYPCIVRVTSLISDIEKASEELTKAGIDNIIHVSKEKAPIGLPIRYVRVSAEDCSKAKTIIEKLHQY